MSEQEREARREPEEAEVEGHIKRARDEGPREEEEGAGIRREGDDPDVEGHMKR
jgi:hypothetical protein